MGGGGGRGETFCVAYVTVWFKFTSGSIFFLISLNFSNWFIFFKLVYIFSNQFIFFRLV